MNPALLEVDDKKRHGSAVDSFFCMYYSLCCVMERTAGFCWVSLQTLAPWWDHVTCEQWFSMEEQ